MRPSSVEVIPGNADMSEWDELIMMLASGVGTAEGMGLGPEVNGTESIGGSESGPEDAGAEGIAGARDGDGVGRLSGGA